MKDNSGNLSEPAIKKPSVGFAVFALVGPSIFLGILITSAFLIAGAGILRSAQIAPEGQQVGIELSNLFSSRWGPVGGFLFLLSGTAALISMQIG